MNKRLAFLGMFVVLIVLGIWYVKSPNHTAKAPQEVTGITVGKLITPVTLQSLAGQGLTIGKSDKVTVINFWASWCPPCREEMPELNLFAEKYKGTIDFYAINIQEPTAKVNEFIQKNHYSFTVLVDSNGAVAKKYQVTAIPTTLVVDKNGIIQFRKTGGVTQRELEDIVKKM